MRTDRSGYGSKDLSDKRTSPQIRDSSKHREIKKTMSLLINAVDIEYECYDFTRDQRRRGAQVSLSQVHLPAYRVPTRLFS